VKNSIEEKCKRFLIGLMEMISRKEIRHVDIFGRRKKPLREYTLS